MSKPKMTEAEVKNVLISLMNSCNEGFMGKWNPVGEGADGFESMYDGLKEIAEHFKVDVSEAKQIGDSYEHYVCPLCGWETYDPDGYEMPCGQSGCNGNCSEVVEHD